jgi:hypothetical protein
MGCFDHADTPSGTDFSPDGTSLARDAHTIQLLILDSKPFMGGQYGNTDVNSPT